VRLLEPEAFGRYKQFFLVAQTVLLVGQLGLTQSLFYFLPRGGERRGAYVAQALGMLAGLGALFGAALFFALPSIAGLIADAGLANHRGALAVYAAAMLAAAPLEGSLTAEGRVGLSALAALSTDVARVAALIVGAVVGGATGLYIAAALVALSRVAALYSLVARRVLPWARPERTLAREQLAMALPFAGAALLVVAQRQLAPYAVSASVSAAAFAAFAVASFHMPVVDILFTPTSEVLAVELGRALAATGGEATAARLVAQSVSRLATLFFPATIGALVVGPQVLVLLFTDRYAGAAPLFLLASLEIPLWILPLDAVLRATGERRALVAVGLVRVGLTALFVIGGLRTIGLAGAVGGAVLAEAIARTLLLRRAARRLGVSMRALVDAPVLGRIALAALVAAWGPLAVRLGGGHGALAVVTAIVLYASTYFPLRAFLLARLSRPALPSGA
jgi:O-antigen/teichoic acid export membrane protein